MQLAHFVIASLLVGLVSAGDVSYSSVDIDSNNGGGSYSSSWSNVDQSRNIRKDIERNTYYYNYNYYDDGYGYDDDAPSTPAPTTQPPTTQPPTTQPPTTQPPTTQPPTTRPPPPPARPQGGRIGLGGGLLGSLLNHHGLPCLGRK